MVQNRENLGSHWTYNLSEMNKRIEELEENWNRVRVRAREYEEHGIKNKTYILLDNISLCFIHASSREFRCLVMVDGEKSGNITKNAAGELKLNAITVSIARLLLEVTDKIKECWVGYIKYSEERCSMEYSENNARYSLNAALKEKIELEEARCEYMGKRVSVCSDETVSIISGVISDVYISYRHDTFVRISTEDNDFYCHTREL